MIWQQALTCCRYTHESRTATAGSCLPITGAAVPARSRSWSVTASACEVNTASCCTPSPGWCGCACSRSTVASPFDASSPLTALTLWKYQWRWKRTWKRTRTESLWQFCDWLYRVNSSNHRRRNVGPTVYLRGAVIAVPLLRLSSLSTYICGKTYIYLDSVSMLKDRQHTYRQTPGITQPSWRR